MSGQNGTGTPEPRKYKWRYGPIRLVAPWVAVAVGIFFAIQGATGGMASIFLITGPILCILGVAAFFLFRWMAKRGI